jgi:hypothetical protein
VDAIAPIPLYVVGKKHAVAWQYSCSGPISVDQTSWNLASINNCDRAKNFVLAWTNVEQEQN